MTVTLVSIGVAARRAGVSAGRLRHWDHTGLLVPARSQSGYRLYSELDISQAVVLRRAASEGHRLGAFAAAQTGRVEPSGASTVDDRSARQRGPAVGQALPGHDGNADTRRLRILRRLTHTLRSTERDDLVLDASLDSALALVDADIGALSYADVYTQRYVLVSRRGLSDSYVRGIDTWRLHEGLAGQAFGLRESITQRDLSDVGHEARAIVRNESLRGYVCVPLLRGSRRLGIIEVFERRPRLFTAAEVELLELVAGWVSPVIDSMLLAREAQFLRDERAAVLRDWTGQTIAAIDAERSITVRLLQAEADRLTSVDSEVSGGELASRLQALLHTVGESHRGSVDMLPLVQQQIVDALPQRSGKAVELEVSDWPQQLPLELVSRLYLIMYGLVSVAARAARSKVHVTLGADDSRVWVDVFDDRDAAPNVDVLAGVTPDLLGAAQSLDAALSAVRHGSGLPGVRVLVATDKAGRGQQSLTWRERRVVEALATGATNRAIAAQLGISPKTLQNHLTGIYRKLGVNSRTQAVRVLA